MKKLVISTGNQNKLREIKYLLRDLDIEVLSKSQVGLGDLDVIEDGKTLLENSKKKALALAEKLDYMVMADDSGLFVDGLNGDPGVYSSRYGGEEGNDARNNKKLLDEMEGLKEGDRTARFKAVITLVTEGGQVHEIEGVCEGRIGFSLMGGNGFGYDPLFIPEGYDLTFGQLEDEVKNKISHRSKALLGLRKELERLI